jgi:hypothetical protein
VTDRKLHTLMHDPQYRVEVARQQTTYNQPSYPSFYLASDVDWATVPLPRYRAPGRARAPHPVGHDPTCATPTMRHSGSCAGRS